MATVDRADVDFLRTRCVGFGVSLKWLLLSLHSSPCLSSLFLSVLFSSLYWEFRCLITWMPLELPWMFSSHHKCSLCPIHHHCLLFVSFPIPETEGMNVTCQLIFTEYLGQVFQPYCISQDRIRAPWCEHSLGRRTEGWWADPPRKAVCVVGELWTEQAAVSIASWGRAFTSL